VSQMEGKTNFSRRLKQSDGLTQLILTPPHILRQSALICGRELSTQPSVDADGTDDWMGGAASGHSMTMLCVRACVCMAQQ